MPPLRAEAFSLLGKAPPSLQTTESAKFKMKYASQRILSQPRLVYTRRLLFTDPPFPDAKKPLQKQRHFSYLRKRGYSILLFRNPSFDDLVESMFFPFLFIIFADFREFIFGSSKIFFKVTCIFNCADHIEHSVITIIIC